MSKRTNCDDNHGLSLNIDIWSTILLFFDDFPPLISYTDPLMMIMVNNGDYILSIHRLMDLSLISKEFKRLIESNHLFSKWKTIFIYNIYSKLEKEFGWEYKLHPNDDDFNYVFKKMVMNITTTYHKMNIQINFLYKRCNCKAVNIVSGYDQQGGLYFPSFDITQDNDYDNDENRNIIREYENYVKNIKNDIEKLKAMMCLIK